MNFIVGTFIGAFLGVAVMTLFSVGSDTKEDK